MLAATQMRHTIFMDGGAYVTYERLIPLIGPYEYGFGGQNGGGLMGGGGRLKCTIIIPALVSGGGSA